MEIRVLGWRYENLRGGLRDVSIDLEGALSRWTLIQMPNGTGKTTTMSLFRAAFSGENLSPQFVRDLRASDDIDHGLFEVRLSIDGKLFRIQIRLNFRDGTHQYWTARSHRAEAASDAGLHAPLHI